MVEMSFTELGMRVGKVTNNEYNAIAGRSSSGNSPHEHAYYISPLPDVPHKRKSLTMPVGFTPHETWKNFVKALEENPEKYSEYLQNLRNMYPNS